MKRKAILLGNTEGLPGVKVDIQRFSNFLMSNFGGAWRGNEIEELVDVSKNVLQRKIDGWKAEANDYFVLMFSGHGGQIRETVLELNKSGETIGETTLRSIAKRQLNIYDCCRSYPEALAKGLIEESARMFAAKEDVSYIRLRYDTRIMQAIPQQALLYSCSIGEVSYDSKDGGVYLKNLLQAATALNDEFKLVGTAHQEAELPTLRHSRSEKHGEQHPDAVLAKCLSSQQLIISMRP
jgi:Caspase domain